jgi:outer membrane protein assembly factor BamB
MKYKSHFAVLIVTASALVLSTNVTRSAINPGKDWPTWRGPAQNGIAATGQNPPVEWNENQNILWHVPIPGRGHGTPTVVADRIYLATADHLKQTQSVLCLDRLSGKAVWSAEIHQGNLDSHGHRNTSQASSTVACDGERIYINFLNGGAVYTTALDSNGKQLWQQKVCDYVTHQGFGSSPVLHGSLVLVSADHRGGGTLARLDRLTGKIAWSVSRPKIANYTSPAVVRANGRDQMVLAGCNLIPTRRSRNHSLSSSGWRRGSGRGGACVLDCPSPRSSPRSLVAGRGRKGISANPCRPCANFRHCSTKRPSEVASAP